LRGNCGFSFGNSVSSGASDATLFFGAPRRKPAKPPMEVE
jgi:hypothetical protein